jgi:alpha-galactosidase
VGINLICLDDGWFGEREDDMTSLGDWTVNLRKFPQGIKGLAEDVNAAGCKFGIWFEPEMVSENSVSFMPDICSEGVRDCVLVSTCSAVASLQAALSHRSDGRFRSQRLYRAHPDWCLCVPGRPRLLGRNQMVLDLSRQDVRDYLADAIFAILAE